ncbi:MAG: NADP oxidoreductase [Actinobacteria bacterium]|nr:MAG: NADP oxidoreductase [Actinomycetota bacterium]
MKRVAIVGAGPAGFYSADQLLSAGFEVDLYDRLPTPFGLVRAGVAPDHPKIKSVTRVYEKTARHPAFRYFGGVELGREVTREDLLERYHALLYAFGTATDRRLGIPGEDLAGSHAATEFVAWYNGHPDAADHTFDLSAQRAVVIGNGNVALDVARMLVLAEQELAPTDTADHALPAFGESAVQEVVILGRRGPTQAAFTTPELRELGELRQADVVVDPAQLEGVEGPNDTTAKRNLEVLRDYAAREPSGNPRRLELRFLRSPVEILGDEQGCVRAVRIVHNRLEYGRAVPTGDEEVLQCGLVLRAVGYRGDPVPGVPFDPRTGRIPNDDGRVLAEDGRPLRGEYAVGWIKRGPSGVIGTNKKCAAETVAHIVEDADLLPDPPGDEDIEAWLRRRAPDHVTWEGWKAIDDRERAAGEPRGRPRVKLVRIAEMLEAARSLAR